MDSAAPPHPVRLLALSPWGQHGGAETMLLRALQAAVSRGWGVTCVVPAGQLTDSLRDSGVEIVPAPVLRLSDGPRLVSAASLAWTTTRWARLVARHARQADLLLVNGLLALPAVGLAHPAVPVVWWVHDVLVRGDRLRLARLCAPAVSHMVGVSQSVLDALEGLPVPGSVLRNGVDLPDQTLLPEARRPPLVIGCNAALTPWKGQDVLLEAVAMLQHGDARLALLGWAPPKDAPYEARLRQRAARPDLAGRVDFLGHRPDPLRVMSAWCIGVSASVDPEASGLGVLEGLSLGLPQVATAHGSPREVLDGAGLLVPPKNPAALAGALDRLLTDEELWQRCARAAPAVVRNGHYRPQQEALLLDLLEQISRSRDRDASRP